MLIYIYTITPGLLSYKIKSNDFEGISVNDYAFVKIKYTCKSKAKIFSKIIILDNKSFFETAVLRENVVISIKEKFKDVIKASSFSINSNAIALLDILTTHCSAQNFVKILLSSKISLKKPLPTYSYIYLRPQFFSIHTTDTVAIGDRYESSLDNTWVLNTKSLAIFEYKGYNFNSISDNLAINSDGLYILEGDSDNGKAIELYLKTGMYSFDDLDTKYSTNVFNGLKRNPVVYLSGIDDNNTILSVMNETAKEGHSIDSFINKVTNISHANKRFFLGRRVSAKWFQYALLNTTNGLTNVDDMLAIVVAQDKNI